MGIGFDAKKAVKNLTGIGNYSRRCINAVSRLQPDTELLLFAPAKHNAKAVEQIVAPHIMVEPSGPMRRSSIIYELWRNFTQWREVRRRHVDVFHGLSNELPFFIGHAGCRTVVTIHDLIFLRYPHIYSWLGRQILHVKTRYACHHADRIIAISECTKNDIMRFYGIPENRIEVIYQSIAPQFFEPVDDADVDTVLKHYGLKRGYVLSVGTMERRKNQQQLIRAAKALPDGVQVVILGKSTPYQRELERLVAELHVEDRVCLLNGVSNDHLRIFYHGASVAVYTSLFEGFGLPVVEALASGCPVVAATGSCLEEAGGWSSVYVSPDDPQQLAQALTSLLADPDRRAKMSADGLKYARQFRDDAMAECLLRLYSKL